MSSTDNVTADLWGARDDGQRLTKLGSFTATSGTTLTSMTVASIAGYQHVIVSPTNIGTGNNVLSGMGYQVKSPYALARYEAL